MSDDPKKAMADALYKSLMGVLEDGRPVAGGEDGPIMGPASASDYMAAMKLMDRMELDITQKSGMGEALEKANKRARANSKLLPSDPLKIAQ